MPVARDYFADTLTPVAAYRAVREPSSFLLESVEHGERWGRFSFIGTIARAHRARRDGVVDDDRRDVAATACSRRCGAR